MRCGEPADLSWPDPIRGRQQALGSRRRASEEPGPEGPAKAAAPLRSGSAAQIPRGRAEPGPTRPERVVALGVRQAHRMGQRRIAKERCAAPLIGPAEGLIGSRLNTAADLPVRRRPTRVYTCRLDRTARGRKPRRRLGPAAAAGHQNTTCQNGQEFTHIALPYTAPHAGWCRQVVLLGGLWRKPMQGAIHEGGGDVEEALPKP